MDQKIKKILSSTEWQQLAERREEVLGLSMTSMAYKNFVRATKLPNLITSEIWIDNILYNKKTDRDKVREYFANFPVGSIHKFIERMLNHLKNLSDNSLAIAQLDLSKVSQKKLSTLLRKQINIALHTHNFLAIIPSIDGSIATRLSNFFPTSSSVEQKNIWLGDLVYPNKENFYLSEEKDFYKLIKLYKQKNKNFENYLNRHLDKYAWIGARQYHFENAWSRENVLERIKFFIKSKKDADKELVHLQKMLVERKKTAKALTAKLGLQGNKKFIELLNLAQYFAYLRTYRTDIIYRSHFQARKLYYEVGKRAGVGERDVLYYDCSELLELAETGKKIGAKELSLRYEATSVVYLGGTYGIFSGGKQRDFIKKMIGTKKAQESESLVGQAAYSGVVRGIVRLVLSAKDLSKVERGDVLVAIMTFPDYVPAMERAAAFVTDEGGILCHAAIISREMKKPCVIGTKIATQILKDGDVVEVDATKGVVKKIK